MASQNFGMSDTSMDSGGQSTSAGIAKSSSKLKTYFYVALVLILILVVAVTALVVLYVKKDSDSDSASNTGKIVATTPEPQTTAGTTSARPTTPVLRNCSDSTGLPPPAKPTNNTDGPYASGAVAADDYRCSVIGADILKAGGTAVDAAVASLFCIGVINMHSAGIGGGAVMVVYSKQNETSEYFNFREKAPGKATKNMFVNKTGASKTGALAIAVPGEVKGMYEAWKKYGKLKWKTLVEPAIKLAREGFIIHRALDIAINRYKKTIYMDGFEGLREIFMKKDGCLKRLGDRLVNQKLAITLERISYDPMSFYEGSLAEDIVNDISSQGGIITMQDLRNYSVDIEPAINASIGDHQLHTTGLPSSGIIVAFMLNVLNGYKFGPKDLANDSTKAATFHKIIETFRYAYARRALLGDKHYANVTKIYNDLLNTTYADSIRMNISNNQSYHNASHYGGYYTNYDPTGTSHLSVLASNGDAVAVTTTVNTYFGSKVRSTVTGIVYNNEMDDFSTPGLINVFGVEPSPSNFIAPGKRPMSSMSPVIFTNKTTGDVVFIAGAAGGTRITTGTALAAMYKLWFGRNTSEAVTDPRFHDQLLPDYTGIEKPPRNLSDAIVKRLEGYGHYVQEKSFYCVVQAISMEANGAIYAKSDPRKGGYPSGY